MNSASLKDHLVVLDAATSAQSGQAARVLQQFLDDHAEISRASLSLAAGDHETELDMPTSVLGLLAYVLAQAAGGSKVAATPVNAELTTQQAADLLAVSRPYLVKLLDERRIPFRRVGNRHKILLSDLMAFKDRDESERRSIAAELAAEAAHPGADPLP